MDCKYFDVFNSVQEAVEDGTMWGADILPLSEEALSLLKEGKVLKTDNGEYCQIIAMESELNSKAVIKNG